MMEGGRAGGVYLLPSLLPITWSLGSFGVIAIAVAKLLAAAEERERLKALCCREIPRKQVLCHHYIFKYD